MITIKELTIDIESGSKIINLIKKHEPEIWNVLKVELKEALNIPVVGKSFYCYNKLQGFNHSLCEVSQCKKCKELEQ